MKPIETQMTFADESEEYRAFVEKFKPKKTTDDCYTPQNIYDVILDWASAEYGIDKGRVVRPFFPGGDYERFPYKEGDVVVDNPPFSILSKIARFYADHEIPFFLFAPSLTNFSCGTDRRIKHIVAGAQITYANGAKVNTSFLTSMGEWFIRSAPDLYEAIREENRKNEKVQTKQLPKYSYPNEVLTAAMVGYYSNYGTDYRVGFDDCSFIRGLDSQRATGKTVFGGGYLLSEKAAAEKAAAEKAAAEKAAAEKAAAEKAAAERWRLSDRELNIIRAMGTVQA